MAFIPNPDPRETWRCGYVDDKTGTPCERGGQLGARFAAFYRHPCYGGHGSEREYTPNAEPVVYDACGAHYLLFQRVHGVAGEPATIHRGGVDREYRRSQWPSRSTKEETRPAG